MIEKIILLAFASILTILIKRYVVDGAKAKPIMYRVLGSNSHITGHSHVSSFILINKGRSPAKNVTFSHYNEDTVVVLQPYIKQKIENPGRQDLGRPEVTTIPILPSGKIIYLTISCKKFLPSPIDFDNIYHDGGVIQVRNLIPAQIFPTWFIVLVWILIVIGTATVLQWAWWGILWLWPLI